MDAYRHTVSAPAWRWAEARLEKRANGAEVIEGTLVRFGDTADIGGFFKERIAPGALEFRDVIANVMHDRARPIARTGAGLELIQSGTELRAVITPAETRDGQEALTLVRSGVLRGLSAEMKVSDEGQAPDGAREIRAATLVGLGIVDRPAYPESLAAIAKRYATRTNRRWAF